MRGVSSPDVRRAGDRAPTTAQRPWSGDVTAIDQEPSRGRLLGGVLLFIAGFTVVFMAVNILGGTVGRFFLEYADAITRVMGVVIILLGLVFIGLFGFAQRTFKPQVRSNLGLIGAPLLGVALGIGWAPCIGPTLGGDPRDVVELRRSRPGGPARSRVLAGARHPVHPDHPRVRLGDALGRLPAPPHPHRQHHRRRPAGRSSAC